MFLETLICLNCAQAIMQYNLLQYIVECSLAICVKDHRFFVLFYKSFQVLEPHWASTFINIPIMAYCIKSMSEDLYLACVMSVLVFKSLKDLHTRGTHAIDTLLLKSIGYSETLDTEDVH